MLISHRWWTGFKNSLPRLSLDVLEATDFSIKDSKVWALEIMKGVQLGHFTFTALEWDQPLREAFPVPWS